MADLPNWLPKLLEEENLQKYHAYFEYFHHNHKAQGAVALARLGATYERVKRHCEAKNERSGFNRLKENEVLTLPTEIDSLQSDNIGDYKGSNVGFFRIRDYFANLYESKYGKDIKKMIKEEMSTIADAPLTSLFHGIIQVAYGYVSGVDSVVIEGISWLFQQHYPVMPKDKTKVSDVSQFGKGTIDIFDVLKEIREDQSMRDDMVRLSNNEDFRKKYLNLQFDWTNLAGLTYYGDRFIQFTDSIKLPDFYDSKKKDIQQVVKLVEWLQEMMTLFYVKSSLRNQFFLLHGITGTWSLGQVIHLLDYKDAVTTVRRHLCQFLVMYATITAPDMTRSPEDHWKGVTVDQAAWDEVIQEAMDKDSDDHVFKVTQILYESWKRNPTGPNSKFYIAGARMSLDSDFNVDGAGFETGFRIPNTIPE